MIGMAVILIVVIAGILFCSFIEWVYDQILWTGAQISEFFE